MGNIMSMATPEVNPVMVGMMGLFFVVYLIVCLAFYVFTAICLMQIAKKTNTQNGWLAWIPIANIFLMFAIAKKPWWWIFLMIVPIVDIVFAILLCIAIGQARGKSGWIGFLLIIPVVNLFVLAYLAFSK